MFGTLSWANFYVQVAFLSVILVNFNFVGISFPEFLFFMVALFLSDLAVVMYQRELNIAYNKALLLKLKESDPSQSQPKLIKTWFCYKTFLTRAYRFVHNEKWDY